MNRKMEYSFIAHTYETDEGKEWYVEFPDIPGVVGGGKPQIEAVEDAFDNLEAHLSFLEEDGVDIPVPSFYPDDSYSGKFALRMSKSLHKRVAINANLEGVSINAYLNEAIAEKVAGDEVGRQYKLAAKNVMEMVTPVITQSQFKNVNSVNSKRYSLGLYDSAFTIGA